MEKKKIYKMVIGVLALILVVVGATYAWFSWKSGNTNISGNTGCFDIDYDKGQDIGSVDNPYAFRPSCSYNEGASASVTIAINESCNTTGRASINLNTTSFNLYDGSDAFTRSDIRDVFKYQVVRVDNEVETEVKGCNGSITSNSTLSLCEVDLSKTSTTYKVYLYLDCNYVTTSYIGSSYTGFIQSVAYQTVE